MTKALAAAPVLWLAVLIAGAVLRIPAVYLAAGVVCHQRPDRSFHTDDVKWPVCARCSGLYATAPIGAVVAVAAGRRLRRSRDLRILAIAAAPTLITFALEHTGLANLTSGVRFVAALPLGAAVAWVVVSAAAGADTKHQVN